MSDPRALVPTTLRKRLTQAVNYGLDGGWFTPQWPLQPQHPETAGRRMDYLAGYNIATRPRRDSGIDFQTLRNFAQFYDILRILLERRKDQITTFEWKIGPTDEAISAATKNTNKKTNGNTSVDLMSQQAEQATTFFKYPDGRTSWNTWLRAVIEDMLVLDAVAVWPVYEGKQLLRLEMIDPATIKLVIDESGRRPEPPYPAYQQVLHGVPTADFLKDELLYFMSNPASNRIYGYSKVEQIILTINIGLRRENSQLAFFTDGNVPAALVGVPDNWPAQTIADFQETFDSILSGDLAARRKIWFVPGEIGKNVKEFKSEEALLKTPFDEWLIRIMCFCIGVSPTPFINQVNRATAFSASEEAREEGLAPSLMFLKDMFDAIINNCLRLKNLEFKWEMEDETDPTSQATIDDVQLKNGSRSLDELRQRDGLDPYGIPAMIYTTNGPVPVTMFKDGTAPSMQPKPDPTQQQQLGPDGKPLPPGSQPPNKPGAKGQPAKDGGKQPPTNSKSGASPTQKNDEGGGLRKDGPFRFKKTDRYYTSPRNYNPTRRLLSKRHPPRSTDPS